MILRWQALSNTERLNQCEQDGQIARILVDLLAAGLTLFLQAEQVV